MANLKISAMTTIGTVTDEDLMAIVDDPAGTALSRKVALSVLKTYFTAGLLTEEFLTTAQTITSAATATIAHGLSAKPKIIQVYIKCTTADFNWSVGDEMEMPPVAQGSSAFGNAQTAHGVAVMADATDIVYRYGSSAQTFLGLNKNNGNTAILNNASWDMYIRAFA